MYIYIYLCIEREREEPAEDRDRRERKQKTRDKVTEKQTCPNNPNKQSEKHRETERRNGPKKETDAKRLTETEWDRKKNNWKPRAKDVWLLATFLKVSYDRVKRTKFKYTPHNLTRQTKPKANRIQRNPMKPKRGQNNTWKQKYSVIKQTRTGKGRPVQTNKQKNKTTSKLNSNK